MLAGESGRNSVQAGDSVSMRESWKPWLLAYHLKLFYCKHYNHYDFDLIHSFPSITLKNFIIVFIGTHIVANTSVMERVTILCFVSIFITFAAL